MLILNDEYDCARVVLDHVLSFMIGPTPNEIRFEDMLIERMAFI